MSENILRQKSCMMSIASFNKRKKIVYSILIVVVVVIAGGGQCLASRLQMGPFCLPPNVPSTILSYTTLYPLLEFPRSSNEGQDKFPFKGVHFLFSERCGAKEFIPQAPERFTLSQEVERCFLIVSASWAGRVILNPYQ